MSALADLLEDFGAQAQAAASRAAPVAMPARQKYCTAQGSQADS